MVLLRSHLTRQQLTAWRGQVISVLPAPILLKMNRIEDEWHQLKTHEIAGRMFEDEYDLAATII